jgi:predicted exporter
MATTSADTLAQQALTRLYQFSTGPRLTDGRPIRSGCGRTGGCRAAVTRVRARRLATVTGDGKDWVLLTYRITKPAFSANGSTDYGDLLHAAEAAARAGDDGVRVVPPAFRCTPRRRAQANWEMNVIGWGSLAAVLLLVWLAFRSLRPIVLVGLSLLIGTAAAISATAIVFDRVHLITLVFGASLVGVAEDFGIHYFVTRQAMPRAAASSCDALPGAGTGAGVVYQRGGLSRAGHRTVPGLRQMALFSAVGLITAFLTVLFWFRCSIAATCVRRAFPPGSPNSLARWPRVRNDMRTWLALGALGLLS